MTDLTDIELVQKYVRTQSEDAFAELVRRHLNLVYSVAFRCTGQNQDAQDVAQAVFIILADKARTLRERTVLAGWLYETTRNTAAHWRRGNIRRQIREQEACMQTSQSDSNGTWQQLAPHLEPAMAGISKHDRTLLARRFYENKTGLEAAAALGIREDAAHKRTARALEKLRKYFTKKGVVLSAAAITKAMSANAIQSAPAGLAGLIIKSAMTGTASTTAAMLAATTKTIAMTTIQKIAVTAALTVTIGSGIYAAKQAYDAQTEVQKLQQQQAPMAEQIQQLQRELATTTNQPTGAGEDLAKMNGDNQELLKLRGQVGVLQQRADAAEQKLAEALSYKTQFNKDEGKAVGNMKILSLAMRMYAQANDGIFTNSPLVLSNELGGYFEAVQKASYEFDSVNDGAVKLNTKDGTIIGPDNMVQFREHIARQAPDGTWRRTYVFADGRVIVANTVDSNFDAWEKANTYLPPTNQGQ